MTKSDTSSIVVTRSKAFDRPIVLACDGNCNKAWGICNRPKIEFDKNDPDDTAYLSDDELGDAPIDPGTYEGGYGKPSKPVHNKWCFRECERSVSCNSNEIPQLPDFSKRRYNQPWKHPESNNE